jgi:putative addiction module component (TIGR02574 family)
MTTAQEILVAANALPEEERLLVAHSLFDSIHEMDEDVEQARVQEVRRRCGEIDRDEVELIPAEEVFEEARRILASR